MVYVLTEVNEEYECYDKKLKFASISKSACEQAKQSFESKQSIIKQAQVEMNNAWDKVCEEYPDPPPPTEKAKLAQPNSLVNIRGEWVHTLIKEHRDCCRAVNETRAKLYDELLQKYSAKYNLSDGWEGFSYENIRYIIEEVPS